MAKKKEKSVTTMKSMSEMILILRLVLMILELMKDYDTPLSTDEISKIAKNDKIVKYGTLLNMTSDNLAGVIGSINDAYDSVIYLVEYFQISLDTIKDDVEGIFDIVNGFKKLF